MQNIIMPPSGIALLSACLAILCLPSLALAQGSAGGSIGNDDKAVSGSRQRSLSPDRPAPQPRRSEPRHSRHSGSGGGGGNFDGAWSISSAGITCSDTFREVVVVTSGKLIGNYGGGTVSGSGAVRGHGNYNGIGVTSQGRFSGRGGSGTFQRSDGCTGRWTARKQ
ncbi:MAG TPA: hypothetical protein VHC94_16035 [Nitrobacter sp.]|jgi:hypothetical protein|nr:hypothetical protein [Nitrobacter sp.]